MSDADDITGLELALAERACKLAEEHLVNGRQARDLILLETRQRLRLEEDREILAAKARSDRIYQQRAQAAELDLRARLDRLRWQLINAVLIKLRSRLSTLAEDKVRYLPLTVEYLREGAQAIEREELVACFNARDRRLLQTDWARHAEEAAPNKRLILSPDILNTIGGVMIVSADGNIRFDNTFEARMERFAELLQRSIAERLTPQPGEVVGG
jgi:V/A-type H+/Na+-transporting ATPase subunit E